MEPREESDPPGLQKARITDPALVYSRELAQLMRLRLGSTQNVPNYHTAHQKSICQQLAVTLPPQGLRAHYRCVSETRKPVKRSQVFDKFFRLHVIGVAAVRGFAKRRVGGVWTRAPHSAQPGKVAIKDPGGLQAPRELRLAELGMAP